MLPPSSECACRSPINIGARLAKHPEMPDSPDHFRLLTCCGLSADLPAETAANSMAQSRTFPAPAVCDVDHDERLFVAGQAELA